VGDEATRQYVTPFLDQNLIMNVLEGEQAGTYYYSQDGLGSVRTLTDATGTVVNRYDYTAFGIPHHTTASKEAVPQRYTYTGRESSAESSHMWYRWRSFNPQAGRWYQRDPLGYAGSEQLYEYARNNAAFFTDPFGLISPIRPIRVIRTHWIQERTVHVHFTIVEPWTHFSEMTTSVEELFLGLLWDYDYDKKCCCLYSATRSITEDLKYRDQVINNIILDTKLTQSPSSRQEAKITAAIGLFAGVGDLYSVGNAIFSDVGVTEVEGARRETYKSKRTREYWYRRLWHGDIVYEEKYCRPVENEMDCPVGMVVNHTPEDVDGEWRLRSSVDYSIPIN